MLLECMLDEEKVDEGTWLLLAVIKIKALEGKTACTECQMPEAREVWGLVTERLLDLIC